MSQIVADYKWSLYGVPEPSEEYDTSIKACHERCAKRLLHLAEVNGGVFIKVRVFKINGDSNHFLQVGQHLGAMEYLIPPEYTKTLSVLMSKAPQQSMEDIKFVIESELGKPVCVSMVLFHLNLARRSLS